MSKASFVIDSVVHGGGYADQATREIFGESARLQRWLDIEVALAKAQQQLGLVPAKAVEEMRQQARIENFDLKQMRERTMVTKHSLMPLLDQLERKCSPETATFIHRGATTQDIQDTALAIEMREVLALVKSKSCEILQQIDKLMGRHRDTLMVGRTHSMPGSPITLGLKLAGWADEMARNIERIDSASQRICVAQLFGSVGSMAAFGAAGHEVLKNFAENLNLGVPTTSWHASRDRVAEYVFLLAMSSSSLTRFADELRTLNRVEIREVIMGFQKGEIGSSTMPHKRNPEDAEQIVVLGRLTVAQVGPMLDAMNVEHERDYRGTRMEWPCVQQASHYSYNALCIFSNILSNLCINEPKIEANAGELNQFLCIERLLGSLTPLVGRTRAFDIVYSLTQISQDIHENIETRAFECRELLEVLPAEKLRQIFDARNYLGRSTEIVDQVHRAIQAHTVNSEKLRKAS